MSLRPSVLALFLLLAVSSPAAASPAAVSPAAVSPAAVDTLAFLGQRVSLSTDGDAVLTVTAVLARGGPGEALLPFGFGRADSFTVAGDDVAFPPGESGAPAPLRRRSGRQQLALVLGPAAAAGDTVVVGCRLKKFADWEGARGEFGAYSLARTFVNDSDVSLGAFRLVLDVPPGYQVRRITGTEPAFRPEASPVPPYAVGVEGGRGFAWVSAKHVVPGGRARLAIEAERGRRGPVPFAGGVLLVLLYLWFFRDVVSPRRTAAGVPQASDGGR
jgi:hypothetical protein